MEIEKKVFDIFKKRVGIDFEKECHLRNQKLLGAIIQLPPRELLMIYMDIEQVLGVTVPKREILKENFDTFDNILRFVIENIEK